MKKKVTIVTTLFFIAILSSFLFIHITSTQAATATSNCIVTKIGNPGINITPPDGCGGTWPLTVKDTTEYERIDQGFDLACRNSTCQKDTFTVGNNVVAVNILAVASGTIYHHNASIAPAGIHPCPSCTGGGFGTYWPYVHLDQKITINGRDYYNIYYGHVHMRDDIPDGTPVQAGQPIAWTTEYGPVSDPSQPYAGTGGPFWLEMGFGDVSPDAPFPPDCNTGPTCWTQQGQDMKDWLLSQNQ